MKINILGTEYDYNITTDKEDLALCNKNGYCDGYGKIIAIEHNYNEKHPDSIKNFDSFKEIVKRHEIIHAYFHESGMTNEAENELMVEWIARQFPKLLKTFQEVEAI